MRLTPVEWATKAISILYTSREGGEWHRAHISPMEYVTSFRTHRFGALTVCAMRVATSSLIYDHILAEHYSAISPWRLFESWPINESEPRSELRQRQRETVCVAYNYFCQKVHPNNLRQ